MAGDSKFRVDDAVVIEHDPDGTCAEFGNPIGSVTWVIRVDDDGIWVADGSAVGTCVDEGMISQNRHD